MEVFPFVVTSGHFLGEDIVIAGTDITPNSQPTSQVKIIDFSGDEDSPSRRRHVVRGEASLRGECSAMELCGFPSLSKNFVAVAVNEHDKGFISVLEAQLNPNRGYQIAALQPFEKKADEGSNVTALAYYSYHAHLAAATEAGDIFVSDISDARELYRKRVDVAGIRSVRYTSAGIVAALGQSNSGQVLLWDPRTSTNGSGKMNFQCFGRPLVNSPRGFAVGDTDSYLTCLETHPTNEYEIYCGTSTGTIVMFDIRKSDSSNTGTVAEVDRCQNANRSEVTAMAFRGGGRSPYLLTGAVDGSVACVNYHEKLLNSSSVYGASDIGVAKSEGEVDIGLDQATSAITSIQFQPFTEKILVTSKLGEVNLA